MCYAGSSASPCKERAEDAVRSGTQPETAGRDNIRSLAMVFGAIESAEVGRHVSIAV